ncbi:MAG: hypothetical protein E6G50_10935 [Actinobacteria bacterium]|nr:MAG: hypothetical protein E6G50_10935 [Actinomycetota bacterium]
MAIAVLALFVSVGLVTIVLVVCAMVVSAGSLLAAALLLHRHRARLRGLGLRLWDRGAEITLRAASRTVPALRRVGAHASAGARTAQGVARTSAVEARTRAETLHRRVRSSALADRRGQAVRANGLEIGDRRAEALTLNNLALALERGGDARALALFEESATILGELGDEQNEGQVIANLALAFRRRGQEQESVEALETALAKLEPESNAYRKAERLRRAS